MAVRLSGLLNRLLICSNLKKQSEQSAASLTHLRHLLQCYAECTLYCTLNRMPKYLTITEARRQLLELPDELTDEPVIITKHGKPVMAALSYEQFESLMETLEILSDREFANRLQESIAQAERGETVSWKEAKAKLGL